MRSGWGCNRGPGHAEDCDLLLEDTGGTQSHRGQMLEADRMERWSNEAPGRAEDAARGLHSPLPCVVLQGLRSIMSDVQRQS